MSKRGRRGLSKEDKALWDRVARSAKAMHKPERSDSSPAKGKAETKAETSKPQSQIEPFSVGQTARGETASVRRGSQVPIRMDMRKFQKMRRGKTIPEARIDLHGMTVAEAHDALIGFVMRAHANGHRLLLVITGKGTTGKAEGLMPVRRGILRHQVPHWLALPPIAPLVLQVETAHERHGGSGALYIYLRRH